MKLTYVGSYQKLENTWGQLSDGIQQLIIDNVQANIARRTAANIPVVEEDTDPVIIEDQVEYRLALKWKLAHSYQRLNMPESQHRRVDGQLRDLSGECGDPLDPPVDNVRGSNSEGSNSGVDDNNGGGSGNNDGHDDNSGNGSGGSDGSGGDDCDSSSDGGRTSCSPSELWRVGQFFCFYFVAQTLCIMFLMFFLFLFSFFMLFFILFMFVIVMCA